MTYLVALWITIALVVAGLALYRKMVARSEDPTIHLTHGEASAVYQQEEFARRIANIDKWGKTLTVVEVVFGLGLLAFWLYLVWLKSFELQ